MMIRATFKWFPSMETGSILEWTKPNMHLTPYHLEVIKNCAFSEFFVPEIETVACIVEVDGNPVAVYRVEHIPENNTVVAILTSLKTGKYTRREYNAERCL